MVTFNAYSSPQRRCVIASLILQKSFVLMNLMKVIQFARRAGSGLAPKDTFLSPRYLPNHTREKAHQMHLRCGTLIFHPAWV